jgi:hypothetical protein
LNRSRELRTVLLVLGAAALLAWCVSDQARPVRFPHIGAQLSAADFVSTRTLQPGLASHGKTGGAGAERVGEYLTNVRSFGARGNGTTDDARAIQAAIDWAKTHHGTLLFPRGRYVVRSPLNLTRMNAVRIVGAESGASAAQVGADSTDIVYAGRPLPKSCPFDFSNSSWIWVSNISLSSASPVACTVLLNSSNAESEDIHFQGVSVGWATIASVADSGAEVVEFSHSSLEYGTGDGLLLSSNGLAGYGISSPFGFKTSPWSMTQVTFRGGKIVSGSGHAIELDGTGRHSSMPVSDVSFFGTYIAGSGSGASAFYVKGIVWALTDIAQRYEIDSQTGLAYFINAAQGARIVQLNVLGLDISPAGYALFSKAGTSNPVIAGGEITGVIVPVHWAGNLTDFDVNANSKLDVHVSGNVERCSFRGEAGIQSFSVSGRLHADVQGWKNVVKLVPIYKPGSGSFAIRQSGHYIATYASDVCAFDADVGPGAVAIGDVHYMNGQSLFSNSGLGKLSCPRAGTRKSASVTATYSGTGGYFVVRVM